MQTQEEAERVLEFLREGWGLNDALGFTTPALFLVVLFALLIFFGTRRSAVLAAIFALAIIPMRNAFDLGGLNFFAQRVVLIAVWIRIFSRGEYRSFSPQRIDKLWLCYSACVAIVTFWRTGSLVPSLSALIEPTLTWFAFRIMIPDLDFLKKLIPGLAAMVVTLGLVMLVEKATVKNFMHFMGGGYGETPMIRDGAVRAQASFGHPIIAGTFGSVMLPFFIAFACAGYSRKHSIPIIGVIGCLGCASMVFASASSGPLLSALSGIVAIALWRFRNEMRYIRRVIIFGYLAMEIVMKAPAYALLWRMTIVAGSTGYHRFQLFDAFVKNWKEWWLKGTTSTAHWGFFSFDVANQYVGVGISGGIIGLGLFIYFLALCYRNVGIGMRTARTDVDRWLLWGSGAALFANMVAFMGIAYFDQMRFLWLLAPAACIAQASLEKGSEQTKEFVSEPIHLSANASNDSV